ncbi:hypothetical protein CFP56_021584 [Quercus suber]|uniref:Uncharacterized protein n=1 Tax=Quercus suber TaxID=58331 RepID=A0AAW0LZF5_QUESU
MGEVDPAFIQEPEHRPKSPTSKGRLPLIDLLHYTPQQCFCHRRPCKESVTNRVTMTVLS